MRIRWRSFRSYRDTDWVTLLPLTVLVGANNTGKTTLYQPLLLLRQTMNSRQPEQALLTKGDFVNLGRFRDLVFRHKPHTKIALGFGDLASTIDLPTSFRNRLGARIPNEVQLRFGEGQGTQVVLSSFVLFDRNGKKLVSRTLLPSGKYTLEGYSRFPPPRGKAKSGLQKLYRDIQNERPDHFMFTGGPGAEDYIAVIDSVKQGKIPTESLAWALDYSLIVSSTAAAVGSTLSQLGYLGPLRSLPKRWYELSGEMPSTVGVGGRNSPEILYRLQNNSLREEVEDWLSRFDLGGSLEFQDLESQSFAVYLRRTPSSPRVNLADCGIGLSQVLPLIVQGLHAQPGALVIVEQPEIHLNPALQARLAELFVSFVRAGKRVILETHSEHLLLRLRTLIAKGDIPTSDVALYFSEKHRDESAIRPILIEADGSIRRAEWPPGFFEESLFEALALSEAQAER